MMNFKVFSYALLAALVANVVFADPALAAVTMNTVAENITTSSSRIPGLITGISYLLALLFGVTGILKVREHVENPAQTPLRIALIRFAAGGALFALPIVLEAAYVTIGDGVAGYGYSAKMAKFTQNIDLITMTYIGAGATNINGIFENIITGISDFPGIITGLAYLIGLISCVSGILKVKEHVENPDRIELKEGVIRLLIGGALFALPTVYTAVENTITGNVGIGGVIATVMPTAGAYLESSLSPDGPSTCGGVRAATAAGLGNTVCNFIGATGASASFITALSYLFGLVIGVWALLKIRDHVLNPQQTPVWEGMSRLIVAGALFSLPYVAGVVQASITGDNAILASGTNIFSAWYNGNEATVTAACAAGGGPRALDTAMACFMRDIMGPAHILFSHFAFIAGLVFIMIGITRLMKTAQDGARGPGGMGTIMTFLTGGILISINQIITFFTATISMTGNAETNAALAYTTGMTPAEVAHAEIIIATILQFMIIVGLISFIRGWFIIRDVAEGNQQASLMSGATHVLGGALAINLGPILAAVQASLGIAGVGVTF